MSTALFAFDASDPDANGVAIASAAILSAVSLMILIYGAVIFCEHLQYSLAWFLVCAAALTTLTCVVLLYDPDPMANRKG